MWAVWAGDGPTEEEEPVEDRRSSASFLRSLGGDDIDDLLNPKAAAALPPSLATNVSTSRTPKKVTDGRYFSPAGPATGASSRSESVRVCFLCGSPEHHAMACPHEVCFQCIQAGHTSKDCREGSPAAFLQHVCGVTHRAQPQQRGEPALRLDVSQVRCLRCGGIGHVDCSPDDGRPKNLSCFNCGGQGHAALGCKDDGMDRWHRRFAPLADSGGKGGGWGKGGGGKGGSGGGGGGKGGGSGKGGGGRPSIAQIHASNRPGPPPERYRNSAGPNSAGPYVGQGSNGRHGSNGRSGGSHSGSNGERDGGGGGLGRFQPPAHHGGGPGRGRDAGGFSRPQGIIKPSANNHTRFR